MKKEGGGRQKEINGNGDNTAEIQFLFRQCQLCQSALSQPGKLNNPPMFPGRLQM